MYKVYLRQAMQMLRQNKFFSIIYITGTGLAITMVMVLAILYYFRTGNIAPETNRDRMLVIQHGKILNKVEGQGNGSSRLSYPTIKECFYSMQTPEAVTAILPIGEQTEFIQTPGVMKYTTDLSWVQMLHSGKYSSSDSLPENLIRKKSLPPESEKLS